MVDKLMPSIRSDRPGIALLVVLLVTMVVGAIAAGAALIGTNALLINEYDRQSSLLETVADAGLELGRARLNANPGLYNDTAVVTLEYDAAVYDASGAVIPRVTRTVYAMPLGGGLGEYGNFSALVSLAQDGEGTLAIRRLDLLRESFAIYAYFTDFESDLIAFGNNDQLYGPVHSNSNIKVRSTGSTFHGPVTTAGDFEGAEYATFLDDTTSQVLPILMPTSSQLSLLRTRAAPAHMAFTAEAGGTEGQSTMRIEFIARDIDGDDVEEGFIRVYRSSNTDWVTSNNPSGGLGSSPNCGHIETDSTFFTPAADTISKPVDHTANYILTSATRRCHLGGSDLLNADTNNRKGRFVPTDSRGAWDRYPGDVHPAVQGQPDADYLFPVDRRLNPAFRGVIHVNGKVVVSGTVRSRLTLAATGNIVIGDDLVYNTNPGAGTCEDMVGLFSGADVIVADNTINAPRVPPGSSNYYTYDETPSENIDASILALNQFTVQNPSTGSTNAESCNGTAWGRGCLNVTGGIIQQNRGIVAYGNGTGNMKRYTHDTCAFTAPPPYFPSTGHFYRGRYYEVDPTGFNIGDYFNALN